MGLRATQLGFPLGARLCEVVTHSFSGDSAVLTLAGAHPGPRLALPERAMRRAAAARLILLDPVLADAEHGVFYKRMLDTCTL